MVFITIRPVKLETAQNYALNLIYQNCNSYQGRLQKSFLVIIIELYLIMSIEPKNVSTHFFHVLTISLIKYYIIIQTLLENLVDGITAPSINSVFKRNFLSNFFS